MTCHTGVIILAAGAGRRMGGVAKALLPLASGNSFLATIADIARQADIEQITVVVGPPHERDVAAEVRRLGLAQARNPHPEYGMSSSVEIGFRHALTNFAGLSAALLWPVDHARVKLETVRTLLRLVPKYDAVIPVYKGQGGHPAALGRALWSELATCGDAPEGARSVLRHLARTRPGRRKRIEVGDKGVIADVDSKADYRKVRG